MTYQPAPQPTSTCRLRLDLHGPTPTCAYRTPAGVTMLTVGPMLLQLPDRRAALALWATACEAARRALPLLTEGPDRRDSPAPGWPVYAAVLLTPGSVTYQVLGAQASPTRRPMALLTLGPLLLACHDRTAFGDVLAGCAGAYDVASRGIKGPTAHSVAVTVARRLRPRRLIR